MVVTVLVIQYEQISDIVNSTENREFDEESIKAQDKVLEELKSIKDKLNLYDWKTIVEIITNADKPFLYGIL